MRLTNKTLVPRSLYGRLLASAGLFIVIALIVAGLSIGEVLERFVMGGLNQRLDAQIILLDRAVDSEGNVDRARVVDAPPFDERGSNWAWQIRTPSLTLKSASLEGRAMPLPVLRPRGERRRHSATPRPVTGFSAEAGAMHFRVLTRETPIGPVTITAAGPREIAERPLRRALVPLATSLLVLGIVLIAAILLQLHFGLRPLAGLRQSLADVRAGKVRHVPVDQPVELRALVDELNALIDENEAGLDNARRHVANLAHGLKTPLAALRVKIDEPGSDPDGGLHELAARMDASIRHHLARARAASPGASGRRATPVAAHITDLLATLARIHADHVLAVETVIEDGLSVACDPQDIDEMLGNLLDNAWRWAASRIAISAIADGNNVVLSIGDDGPGLSENARADALIAGRRLDERGQGHGFGLSIARELAELYGGSLKLGTSALGGLAVTLVLPRAAAP